MADKPGILVALAYAIRFLNGEDRRMAAGSKRSRAVAARLVDEWYRIHNGNVNWGKRYREKRKNVEVPHA